MQENDWQCYSSAGQSLAFHYGDLDSIPDQVM
jgi:hypothetical protein